MSKCRNYWDRSKLNSEDVKRKSEGRKRMKKGMGTNWKDKGKDERNSILKEIKKKKEEEQGDEEQLKGQRKKRK